MVTIGTKTILPAGFTLLAPVILHAVVATSVPSSLLIPHTTGVNIATATPLVLFDVALAVPVNEHAAEHGSIRRRTRLHAESVVRHIRKSRRVHVLIYPARAIRWIR